MHLDLRHLSLLAALVLAPAACGSDGDDNGNDDGSSDGTGVTCAAQATLTTDAVAKTATGVGTVTCDGDAAIQLEVCVQWNPDGPFEDIQCMTGSQGPVTSLTVDNLSSCGISAGRTFRTRVNASIDGVALAEVLSDEAICF